MSLNDQIEAMKTHPLESARQTGRSTRMMEAAKAVAESGQPAVVIFKDERMASLWREKYKGVNNLSVIAMKLRMPELDFKQLKIVDGQYASHQSFIDHDVLYVYHKELFKAYHQYDRQMDQAPYVAYPSLSALTPEPQAA